ncbi:MAG TPA: HAD-IIIC family phosphatase [Polyangiaceae bacterium]
MISMTNAVSHHAELKRLPEEPSAAQSVPSTSPGEQPAEPPPAPPRAERDVKRPSLARALSRQRAALAHLLIRSLRGFEKYAEHLREYDEGNTELLCMEVGALVDYLVRLFRTGDPTYRHIYIGEKLKHLHYEGYTSEQYQENARRILERDALALTGFLEESVCREDLELLSLELQEVTRILLTPGGKRVRVLLVGDCLFGDVLSFATVPCLEQGIRIEPSFAASKNPAELQDIIRQQKGPFDLVVFSPFTYQFSLPYIWALDYRNALAKPAEIQPMVDKALRGAEGIVTLLADLHECPIFVHNTSQVRRHDSTPVEIAKCVVTRNLRKKAGAMLNAGVKEMVDRIAHSGATHVHLFDETRVLNEENELQLGRMFYNSPLQHPTVLSKALATEYEDLLAARAFLLGKKVIVTDLDNTLWRGLVGEGEVVQFRDRQALLRRLKQKGVLLAVASKNDPGRVRWNEALLGDEDFVAKKIDWRPKAVNVKELQAELELRPDAFVFIDDRPDERALVEAAVPGLIALDAEDPRSWRRLELWETLLGSGEHEDRTRWYREREQRGAALETARKEGAEDAFKTLELKAVVREAQAKDLARIVELINRSNQFNLCGTRTSLREAREWLASPERRILVAEASDRFGAMGLVGIAWIAFEAGKLVVPTFVLSCRVFGYGIEKALLSSAVRLRPGISGVVGKYKETPANGPCKTFYPDQGFVWQEDAWRFDGAPEIVVPSWLSVSNQIGR